MRYSIPAAFVAFVASAVAQTAGFDAMSSPAQSEAVAAGSTYTIVWAASSYTTETVSLSLLGGASSTTLQDLGVIASGVPNGDGSYAWAVDASLGTYATYGLKIVLDSNSEIWQYSFPFQITAAVDSNENTVSSVASSSAEGYATTVISSSSSAAVETYAAEATSSEAVSETVSTTCESSTVAETSYAATTIATSSSVAPYPTTTFAATTSATYGNYSTSTFASHTKTASAGSNSTATSTPVAAGAARSLAGSLALVGSLALAAVFAL